MCFRFAGSLDEEPSQPNRPRERLSHGTPRQQPRSCSEPILQDEDSSCRNRRSQYDGVQERKISKAEQDYFGIDLQFDKSSTDLTRRSGSRVREREITGEEQQSFGTHLHPNNTMSPSSNSDVGKSQYDGGTENNSEGSDRDEQALIVFSSETTGRLDEEVEINVARQVNVKSTKATPVEMAALRRGLSEGSVMTETETIVPVVEPDPEDTDPSNSQRQSLLTLVSLAPSPD